MKSPFPGMDPYLEGYLWPDVHNELASVIRALLVPALAPKYIARIDLYTVTDASPETELGIMYPDVALLKRNDTLREPAVAYGGAISPPSAEIPSGLTVPVRIPVVEIRDAAKNRLITAIEILSPVNKKPPALEQYRKKRIHLHHNGVHLIEIDLIRRGTRPFEHRLMPATHYVATLMRAGAYKTEVWGFNVQDTLPVLPVPLAAPDPDVPLHLKQAIDLIYERSRYELSIDYDKAPPPPEFSAEVLAWMRETTETEPRSTDRPVAET